MSYQELIYSVEEKVATITLNRPDRMNALTRTLEAEIHKALDEADDDRKVRAIILTGNGPGFCAGYDQGAAPPSGVRHSDPQGKSHAEFIEYWQRNDAKRAGQWTHMWGLGKPVIAAVNGRADSGGLELALACQLVVADEAASFALPDTGIGQPPGPGVLVRLPRIAGRALAHDMIVTGRRIDAAEALAAGLVVRTVPTGKALAAAREMAADIVTRSPIAIRTALSYLDHAEQIADPVAAIANPAELLDSLIAHDDPVEGLAALRERRVPHWRNT
jgi:acetyl-CoA C-acetyltransferase